MFKIRAAANELRNLAIERLQMRGLCREEVQAMAKVREVLALLTEIDLLLCRSDTIYYAKRRDDGPFISQQTYMPPAA